MLCCSDNVRHFDRVNTKHRRLPELLLPGGVSGHDLPSGPIIAKTAQAAILAFNGGDPANAPNVTNGVPLWTSSVRVPLPGDSSALVTWQKNGTVGIALQVMICCCLLLAKLQLLTARTWLLGLVSCT